MVCMVGWSVNWLLYGWYGVYSRSISYHPFPVITCSVCILGKHIDSPTGSFDFINDFDKILRTNFDAKNEEDYKKSGGMKLLSLVQAAIHLSLVPSFLHIMCFSKCRPRCFLIFVCFSDIGCVQLACLLFAERK